MTIAIVQACKVAINNAMMKRSRQTSIISFAKKANTGLSVSQEDITDIPELPSLEETQR